MQLDQVKRRQRDYPIGFVKSARRPELFKETPSKLSLSLSPFSLSLPHLCVYIEDEEACFSKMITMLECFVL